jgi:hypothetical protein
MVHATKVCTMDKTGKILEGDSREIEEAPAPDEPSHAMELRSSVCKAQTESIGVGSTNLDTQLKV